jgi:hypothetical protein
MAGGWCGRHGDRSEDDPLQIERREALPARGDGLGRRGRQQPGGQGGAGGKRHAHRESNMPNAEPTELDHAMCLRRKK